MAIAPLLKLARRYRHLGLGRLIASVVARGLLEVFEPVLRKRMAPSLRQIVSAGRAVGTADAFVQALLGNVRGQTAATDAFTQDFGVARNQLADRCAVAPPDFPPIWAVGDQSALALYLVVRLSRPEVIVETGVASGHSSFLLLSALEANGHGRLVSLDVLPTAGALVPIEMRSRWQLVILDKADPIADATRRLSTIDHVDLFFHDADHSYVGQYADYSLASRVLARGRLGILLSDDVDESFAFIDYVESKQLDASVLVDVRKALGGCVLSRGD